MELQTGLYEHYKGSQYRVLHLARHSETEEWLVVYKQCYGNEGVWVRPIDMFMERVVLSDGSRVPRFTLINAE